MSWIRTATAMIGFGFTIFQFFERFKQQDATQPIAMVPSRIISIGLITAGTLALFIAVREYRRTLRYLWSEDFRDIAGMEAKPSFTPALSVATLLILVGVVTLVAVIAQLLATTT